MDELKAIASTLEREEGMGSISVELMDPNVAEIYAKSPRSRVSLGDIIGRVEGRKWVGQGRWG